ncbi:hypothetical protein RvY_07505 [Ramazzottius varieornatus]|uniref:C2H2-type domain-containing protein n=1 Tax=Ramazzottius varieornatus TaxID=947166 RepID=A0A1D1V2E8_RAMVA|nr:hypothetical protein RvY_07505 [Ramazzottius varieornatus]
MPNAFRLFKKKLHHAAEGPSLAAMELAFPPKTDTPLKEHKSRPSSIPYFPSPNTPWPPVGLPTATLPPAHLYQRQPLSTKHPESLWINNNFPPFSTTAFLTCGTSRAPSHWSPSGPAAFRPYHAPSFYLPPHSPSGCPTPKAKSSNTAFDIDTILGNPCKKVSFHIEEDKDVEDEEMRTEGEPSETHEKPSRKSTMRYQCPECKKCYSTMSGLTKHREFYCMVLHQQTFKCKFCDKVYGTIGALKMHMRTHTLPNQCTVCGRRFSRPWLLQGHMRTHSGEKPFQCPQCMRPFADRSNLRAHLQTHADIKKYKCQICSKTFSRMSLLNKHQNGSCRPGSSGATSCCEVEGTLV